MGSVLNLGSWKKRKSSGVGGGSSQFRSPSRGRAQRDPKAFRRTQSEAARHTAPGPPPPHSFALPHPTQSFAHLPPPQHSQHQHFHSATLGRPLPNGSGAPLSYSTATLPSNPQRHPQRFPSQASNGYLGRNAANLASGYYYSGRGETQDPRRHPHPHQHPSKGGSGGGGGGGGGGAGGSSVGLSSGTSKTEMETPSYWVEHLATFAVGPQFGLSSAADGIRKLKQMERSSAIWAQPMVLRLRPQTISVEDENGELVESFPMALVQDPTAHLSSDPNDTYNNILLFVVREDRSARSATPTEMHIFQCNRVSANDVVADLSAYISRDYRNVRPGRRDTGYAGPSNHFPPAPFAQPTTYTRTESREIRPSSNANANGHSRIPNGIAIADDVSHSSDSSEYFERDVNTLNRCFDDIERFVSRIQSAALAQREMEAAQARKNRGRHPRNQGIQGLRAQLPGELEFVDVLQKFKLSFNLLAKLKNHIHEPNAPELLHFLFTPLTVILDACQWGLGRNIAPQVLSPLITREASDLLRNCLTSKESDVWMALGDAWRTPPEDWPSALPPPYRPVFADGYMPYGAPGALSQPPPPSHPHPQPQPTPPQVSSSTSASASRTRLHPARSTEHLHIDLDRMSLEKDKLEFERDKVEEEKRRIAERERKVWEEERRLEEERMAVERARERLAEDQRSVVSSQAPGSRMDHSAQSSPSMPRRGGGGVSVEESPRQRAFLDDLRSAGAKIAVVNYERIGHNPKELSVTKGEYLEVLSDRKKWWECRNAAGRLGYVPHTIMHVMQEGGRETGRETLFVQPSTSATAVGNGHGHASNSNGFLHSNDPAISPGSRPDYEGHGSGQEHVIVVERRGGGESSMGIPPPAPPPPAPAPPPPHLSTLTSSQTRKAPPRTSPPAPIPNGIANGHEHEPVKTPSSSDLLRDELERTIGRGGTRDELLIRPKSRPSSNLLISERSPPSEVALWLQEKGFAQRTSQLLRGKDGAYLYAQSKGDLMAGLGREEGTRLASLLLVQKKLSGFQTRSGAELAAILHARKSAAEGPLSNTVSNSNSNGSSQPLSQIFQSPS